MLPSAAVPAGPGCASSSASGAGVADAKRRIRIPQIVSKIKARLVVVATQRRRDGVARFLEAASAHFTVEELREDSFHPDYYHHDLQVLVLTPR